MSFFYLKEISLRLYHEWLYKLGHVHSTLPQMKKYLVLANRNQKYWSTFDFLIITCIITIECAKELKNIVFYSSWFYCKQRMYMLLNIAFTIFKSTINKSQKHKNMLYLVIVIMILSLLETKFPSSMYQLLYHKSFFK